MTYQNNTGHQSKGYHAPKDYQAIEDHAIIGNMRTVALVSIDGTIDWFCPQQFDSPAVFAAILDHEKGGHFAINPVNGEDINYKQFYWPDTNVLITRFLSADGVAEITDYMPVGLDETDLHHRWLIRQVHMVRGTMPLRVECAPAFNFARDDHETHIEKHGVCFFSKTCSISLSTDVPLREQDGAAVADLNLQEGDTVTFCLTVLDKGESCPIPLKAHESDDLFMMTVDYWRRWLSQCTYQGRWREMVYRSALVLKLMTFEPTGAIIAAPTTSLPEEVGGERNWDYRYSWMRDSAFTLYGLLRIGFTEEAKAFIKWLEARIHELEPDGSLQIMYTIDGGHEIPEETLDHLEGYKQSKPVRVGNAAYKQLQLDIYGELMDAIYLYNKYGEPISFDLWQQIVRILDWLVDHWQLPDEGIWEVRGGNKHFTYSKLMCWVAFDRGVRLADKRSFPAPRQKWLETRDKIYLEIMDKAWNDEIKAFTQFYGSDTLDGSLLIMPLVFFMSPSDPRMLSTIEAINRKPHEGGLVSDSLVYRYNTVLGVDGLSGEEGTFNMVTFWLVEALTRGGQLDQARRMFEKMLGYANHVGLYAEETGVRGEALGNFPQAFTHLALISAAFNLDRHLNA